MATPRQWFQGARPRTLPAAVAPVLVGTAVAWFELGTVLTGHAPLRGTLASGSAAYGPGTSAATLTDQATAIERFLHEPQSVPAFLLRALLALVVSLALQVGVNYANDYSDGIRGTDEVRVGPVRLVGQRFATPAQVRLAALLSFGVAALAGVALVALCGQPWLLLVGASAVVAAWFYTGGPRPYGYAGLGEVFVFVFFGVVAVTGTTYTQTIDVDGLALWLSVGVGALVCAVLVVNNLRDIPGDTVAGKRTLAVRIGDRATRRLYVGLVVVAYVVVALGGLRTVWLLLGLSSAALAVGPVAAVRGGASGRDLVPVLVGTGRLVLGYAVAVSLGLLLGWFVG